MKIHGNRIFLSLILALVIGLAGSAVAQPAAPVLSPTKGYSTFHPFEDMTFNWSPVAGASSYILQAATDPSFPITSIVFNNIPNPTFSFATTDQGSYFARVIAVDANGVQSKPSNLITFTVFYNNPLPAPPSPIQSAARAPCSSRKRGRSRRATTPRWPTRSPRPATRARRTRGSSAGATD